MRIAFGNKARTGKDTAVEYLIKKYGGKSIRFASPVYEVCELIQDYIKVPKQKNPTLLQIIGMGIRKAYDDNIWVNVARNKINELSHIDNIYIPDLRFEHEYKMLKEMGFITIRIN